MGESTILTCPSCGQKNRVRETDRAQARCGRCHTPLVGTGGGRPVTVTDANFERDVLGAPGLVLVDFWAPWCGPCRAVAPVLERLSERFRGRLEVAKVNTDENPRVASQMGIQSIPTLLLFRGGKLLDRQVGALPASQLESWVARHLA